MKYVWRAYGALNAAFCRERRMKSANATKFHRKSWGAAWKDLRFLFGSRTFFSPYQFSPDPHAGEIEGHGIGARKPKSVNPH
jgi:hypothetical protein